MGILHGNEEYSPTVRQLDFKKKTLCFLYIETCRCKANRKKRKMLKKIKVTQNNHTCISFIFHK